VAYSGSHLMRLLKSLNIKRVVMRYSGEEGRATVSSVNFLTSHGSFMGYQDIISARIPENEFYALGLEILSLCKKDWADDWGGRGEISWDIGGLIYIDHQDRRVDEINYDLEIEERELRHIIDHADIPQTEISGLAEIGCTAVYHGSDTPLFGNYFCDALDGKPDFSGKLTSGMEKVFSSASELIRKRIGSEDPCEAKFTWSPHKSIKIECICDTEVFSKMHFWVSEADLKQMELQ
jgi:hypothetical protein